MGVIPLGIAPPFEWSDLEFQTELESNPCSGYLNAALGPQLVRMDTAL